jgi:HupE / UreJ protein
MPTGRRPCGEAVPGHSAPLAYSAGFVVATGCLHLTGIGLGTMVRWLSGPQRERDHQEPDGGDPAPDDPHGDLAPRRTQAQHERGDQRRQHDARSQQTRDEEISQHARGHGGRAVGGTMRDPKDQTQAFRHPRRQMPVHRDQQPKDQER